MMIERSEVKRIEKLQRKVPNFIHKWSKRSQRRRKTTLEMTDVYKLKTKSRPKSPGDVSLIDIEVGSYPVL